jgi:hypothetical protein
MEAGGRRRRGQRILYFFRTPPAVRVGREAIDADAMRLLEEHNPDVSFDWARLLKAGPPVSSPGSPSSGAAASRQERRRDRREQRARGQQHREIPESGSFDAAAPDEPDHQDPEPAPASALGAEPELSEPAVASEPPPAMEEIPLAEVPERYARLGVEGLSRLRARYADIAVRLAARPMEETERAELMARVEQLNPDAWRTVDEVAAALEAYESVFESLRSVVGRRRRP